MEPALEKIVRIVRDLAIKEYPPRILEDDIGIKYDANQSKRNAYEIGALAMAKLVAKGLENQ